MTEEEINLRSNRRNKILELLTLFNENDEEYSYSELLEKSILILKHEFNRVKNKETKYKKYIVFGFHQYEARGGINDIVGSEDTLEEAKKLCSHLVADEYDIVDRDTWEVVYLTISE